MNDGQLWASNQPPFWQRGQRRAPVLAALAFLPQSPHDVFSKLRMDQLRSSQRGLEYIAALDYDALPAVDDWAWTPARASFVSDVGYAFGNAARRNRDARLSGGPALSPRLLPV